ncbi:hypothetical protein DID88_005799 [Monilinia fructigena]|uniref:C3H1-type domain-containing protein n=1 Tax=Monilinia fructigena TaxID=38457 RepID=A0A395J1X5_9HELO|nr:hypothetical protein DID88_005799 [Monilinia fructigena]
MRQRSRFYGQSSYNMRGRVRETCRRWQQGHCSFEDGCYFNHFEGPPQIRGRQPVLNQDSRQNIRDNPRPDTPVPNTQRSQTLRLESPDEAKPRNSVATPTKFMPSTLFSTHTEETPPLLPTKEDDFISIDTNTGRKRYLKTECAIILQSIEENHKSYPSDSYMVLQIASKQLQDRTTICRSVEECWVYWKNRGRLDSKTASHWPLDAEDIDMEVMMPRRIKNGTTSSYAITSGQAALQIASTAAMVSAIMPTIEASKLWPKEQKEFLCEVIKKKKNVQQRQSKEVFWQEVGENMAEAGYKEGYRMFRDYWDKHGRNEFRYDELPYFEREATPETIKQKRPIRRARPPGDRYTPDQRLPYDDEDDDECPPKSGLKSLSLRRREEGIRARRRSLTPESPLKPIQNRKRLTTAGRNSPPTRPTKKRVPSTPPYRLPKAPVPQRIDSILHNMYSQYHVKDNTAKMASNFPLPLIAPATGEVLYPSLNFKEMASSEPPHKNIQPVDRFISHDTPREISTAKKLATQQILSSPAKNSQIPVKKVSSKVAAKGTKYNQPDSKSSARPAQDDFTKTAQSFEFRSSQQKDFSASLERTQPASRPRSEKAAMAKITLETTAESNEQTKGGSIPSREEKEQAKSPSVASDSSDVSASTISQTQTEVEVAPSVISYTTDRYGNEHHLYQGENVRPHRNGTSNQGITDYSDEDTIFVENNRTDGEVIAEPEESTLIPSVTASARSCFSGTPSLSDDHSTTSDERMVNAPQLPRETSTDQADAGVFTEKMFQKELERTKSTISTMQHDVLKIKEENKETEKKIEDCQQKINTLTLARDVLKESHARNAAEIHRLEEKIESVETYKQATEILIECYKVKESKE